jgi:hypothetical protein
MTVARARHYPTPPPVAAVLAAERCTHGEITGRCALCRAAAARELLGRASQDTAADRDQRNDTDKEITS